MSHVVSITTKLVLFEGTTEQCLGACRSFGWQPDRSTRGDAVGIIPTMDHRRLSHAYVRVDDHYDIDATPEMDEPTRAARRLTLESEGYDDR